MTEREALLTEIFNSPADDTPRLVYADWLEEHDEPAQAAFIRFQCEQSKQGHLTEETPEQVAIWKAFQEERKHQLWHFPFLGKHYFQRGFVQSLIKVPIAIFLEQSANWWPYIPIRGVSLELASWHVQPLIRCTALQHLRELRLEGGDPHGLIIPYLANCPYLENLEILDLSDFELGIEAIVALAESLYLNNLQEFRMPHGMRATREGGRLLQKRFGPACLFGTFAFGTQFSN